MSDKGGLTSPTDKNKTNTNSAGPLTRSALGSNPLPNFENLATPKKKRKRKRLSQGSNSNVAGPTINESIVEEETDTSMVSENDQIRSSTPVELEHSGTQTLVTSQSKSQTSRAPSVVLSKSPSKSSKSLPASLEKSPLKSPNKSVNILADISPVKINDAENGNVNDNKNVDGYDDVVNLLAELGFESSDKCANDNENIQDVSQLVAYRNLQKNQEDVGAGKSKSVLDTLTSMPELFDLIDKANLLLFSKSSANDQNKKIIDNLALLLKDGVPIKTLYNRFKKVKHANNSNARREKIRILREIMFWCNRLDFYDNAGHYRVEGVIWFKGWKYADFQSFYNRPKLNVGLRDYILEFTKLGECLT